MRTDVGALFEWIRENGEVKAIDRVLLKVMLLLVRHKIVLTASMIERMETGPELPDEIVRALVKAAEEVVGRKIPDFPVAS